VQRIAYLGPQPPGSGGLAPALLRCNKISTQKSLLRQHWPIWAKWVCLCACSELVSRASNLWPKTAGE